MGMTEGDIGNCNLQVGNTSSLSQGEFNVAF